MDGPTPRASEKRPSFSISPILKRPRLNPPKPILREIRDDVSNSRLQLVHSMAHLDTTEVQNEMSTMLRSVARDTTVESQESIGRSVKMIEIHGK